MYSKMRVVFGIEGSEAAGGVRVQPHEFKPGYLMVKSPSKEGLGLVFGLMGLSLNPHDIKQGRSYFRVEVPEAAFADNMSRLMLHVMGVEREAFDAYKRAEADKKAATQAQLTVIQGEGKGLPAGVEKCKECGTVDGIHWGYCENGQAPQFAASDMAEDL